MPKSPSEELAELDINPSLRTASLALVPYHTSEMGPGKTNPSKGHGGLAESGVINHSLP